MNALVSVNLHFRCAFDLRPKNGPVAWDSAVKVVRSWISQKERSEELHKAWFFIGGLLRIPGRCTLTTERFIGGGSDEFPDHWAVRYEHPCGDAGQQFRWWRTDVGLTRLVEGDGCRVVISNSHWIAPGYFGEEAPPPPPTAPRLVSMFLANNQWEARAGSELLDHRPQKLEVGEGKMWAERLTDPRRTSPLVYLSAYEDGSPTRIDGKRLASLLAGAAVVVEGGGNGLDDELAYCIPPKEYRCWDGAVRVYLPSVDLKNRPEGKRHRYFSARDIEMLGPEKVTTMLVVGLARRSPALAHGDVSSPDDVLARKREARFTQLRLAAKNAENDPKPELLVLFEEENQALTEKTRELDDLIKGQQIELEELGKERDDLLANVEGQQREMGAQAKHLVEVNNHVRGLELGLSAFQSLAGLPTTVKEVIGLVRLVFPGRITFTERALKSAQCARINEKPAEMSHVWAVLRAMATELHTLHFGNDKDLGGDFRKLFESRTPFKLSLTETGPTKDHGNLMKLREDTYKGTTIDITPHVKYGDALPPRLLRVHYHPHPLEKILVVGHCGDHLKTAGTDRRK